MDPRLLKHYNRELQYIREMGGEFAAAFPKIAGRLGLDSFECADPYVERLLEGFAFLTARVQLKLEAEFPRFTQHLFQMTFPQALTPIPSMAIVQFQPDLAEGSLMEGFTVPRSSQLRSRLGQGEQTACEYRTAHDVTLWPIEIAEAEYFSRDAATIDVPAVRGLKAGLRLRLRTAPGVTFQELALDRLCLYLRGGDDLPVKIYEQLLANALGVVARPARKGAAGAGLLDRSVIRRVGFDEHQALLPYGPRSFQGYRLLHEYFALPARFLFVEIGGLETAVKRCGDRELDVIVLLNRSEPSLENNVNASDFALFASPAINLFPKRADRIHLSDKTTDHHVIPDRTRPLDFEVYEVTGVVGHGTQGELEQPFRPFYALDDLTSGGGRPGAYFSTQRRPRVLSARQRVQGPRSSYVGSEVFIGLVDAAEAPYRHDLRQLSVTTLSTNRDLPLHMPIGKGPTDFTLSAGAPVESIRCIAGPSRPRPALAHDEGEIAWRLINHLTLNYLSLLDTDDQQGAAALRELLSLYAETSDAPVRKQIEGVRSASARSVVRPVPVPGPIAYGRGLEITVTCDESGFQGSGVFLLGAVLEQFFAKYVSVNSFTETVIRTTDRGEIVRWPARLGRRQML